MKDFIETLAILLSLALIASPVIGYAIFNRYLKRKETAVLEEYGLISKKEKQS